MCTDPRILTQGSPVYLKLALVMGNLQTGTLSAELPQGPGLNYLVWLNVFNVKVEGMTLIVENRHGKDNGQ